MYYSYFDDDDEEQTSVDDPTNVAAQDEEGAGDQAPKDYSGTGDDDESKEQNQPPHKSKRSGHEKPGGQQHTGGTDHVSQAEKGIDTANKAASTAETGAEAGELGAGAAGATTAAGTGAAAGATSGAVAGGAVAGTEGAVAVGGGAASGGVVTAGVIVAEGGRRIGKKTVEVLRNPSEAQNIPSEAIAEGEKWGKRGMKLGIILGSIFFFILLFIGSLGAVQMATERAAHAKDASEAVDPAFEVYITDGPKEAHKGDTLTYTIIVFYPKPASDITLAYVIPPGTQFLSSSHVVSNIQIARTIIWQATKNKISFPMSAPSIFTINLLATKDQTITYNYVTAGIKPLSSCGAKSTPPNAPDPQFACAGESGAYASSDHYYYATSFGCSKKFGPDPNDQSGGVQCPIACPKIPSATMSTGENTTLRQTNPGYEEDLKWFSADAERFGCNARLKVTNPLTGKTIIVLAIDKGPACFVEKKLNRGVIDLSKDAANELFGSPNAGWSDKKSIQVELIPSSEANTTPLGPIQGCAP